MEKLLQQLSELLEIDAIDAAKSFNEYDEFDSLACLSILALLDSEYHTSMTYKDIASFKSIEDFCKEVLSRQ